ncbi:MAG: hypothetical protein IM568_00170 [Flavobacterium sp.]|nr:hypothetical protein [Flavobacterium sp.]
MKKIFSLSVISLVYIIIYRITNFETGDIGSATILIFGVPFFVLVSLILFLISLFKLYKEKFNTKSLTFVTLIINLITIVLTFEIILFFLNPINW